MKLTVTTEEWPLAAPFRISGHTFLTTPAITVKLSSDGCVGYGEAAGVHYRNDGIEHMLGIIEAARSEIESGIDRSHLQEMLPAGGARNALDCALWDLEAKRSEKPAWQLAGLSEVRPLLTTFTCGAESATAMAARASAYTAARAIKIKLVGDKEDADRVRAVRAACPTAWIGIDGNQGFSRAALEALMPVLLETEVKLIEQPFPVGQEDLIDGLYSPIALAADESLQTSEDLPALGQRFSVVNIKLDKCGGLTAALELARMARNMGLGVMVGNMVGTSLAMAPAFIVGQLCDIVDLDGPALLATDRFHRVVYADGYINCPPAVWGGDDSTEIA
jgi:L-alanine-DL-glutamate epimerase-like enolase superfamily enzyme